MNSEREKKIRLGYGIFLSAYTVIVGLMYIFSCAEIYYAGIGSGSDFSFSREIVGEHLSVLLAPSVIWIIAVIVGFIIAIVVPHTPAVISTNDDIIKARTLRRKIPSGSGEEYDSERKKLSKINIARIAVWSFCAAFALCAAIITIVYLSDLSNFPGEDPSAEILGLLRTALCWIVASFDLFLCGVIFETVISRKELKILKKLFVLGRGGEPQKDGLPQIAAKKISSIWNSNMFVYGMRLAIFSLAVVFIVLGALNGGSADVLKKAINICTECIGLG